jgi:GntR family transcriptional regulator, sialic acid-inducible nan operon repressor
MILVYPDRDNTDAGGYPRGWVDRATGAWPAWRRYWTDQIAAAIISRAAPAGNRIEPPRTVMPTQEKANRIYQDVALKLAEKINSGELPDGSLLPSERVLAEMFGASRTSIREALLSLQSSGLISVREKARARVTQLSNSAFFRQLSHSAQSLMSQPNGMEDFQEARVLFECGIARYAARHASQKEIERMAIALAHNKRAIGDPAAFARTDVAFHDALAAIPRNPIFTALNTALSEWLMQQRTIGIAAPIRGAVRNAYLGHEAVYEAIAAHDVEGADQAMANHLKMVSEAYWKAMANKVK